MKRWVADAARGFLMGLADVVPGVSGGTIALALGIYGRLIDALASLGPTTLKLLRSGSFLRALRTGLSRPDLLGSHPHGVDARRLLFLGALAAGVIPALLVGTRTLPALLGSYPVQVRALFLGLVLASVSLPLRRIEVRRAVYWIPALGAAVLTAWFVGLPVPAGGHARGVVALEFASPAPPGLSLAPASLTLIAPGDGTRPGIAFGSATATPIPAGETRMEIEVVARRAGSDGNLPPGSLILDQSPLPATLVQDSSLAGGRDPALLWLFAGGLLAISAMVLPGVSGAFVLLLLGLYDFVLYSVDAAIFYRDPVAALRVGVFALALTIGLLTFVRLLRRLFARWRDLTLAVLVGLMAGSLRALWPFMEITAEGTEAMRMPLADEPGTLPAALFFVAGIALVLGLGRLGRRGR